MVVSDIKTRLLIAVITMLTLIVVSIGFGVWFEGPYTNGEMPVIGKFIVPIAITVPWNWAITPTQHPLRLLWVFLLAVSFGTFWVFGLKHPIGWSQLITTLMIIGAVEGMVRQTQNRQRQ